MPVPAYTGPNVSTANGVATVFAYDFQVFDEDHLVVTVDGVEVSNYTVSGVGEDGGGSITFDAAPEDGAEVLRERRVPYERKGDYQRNGGWREEEVDRDFDLLEMQVQQLDATLRRSVKAPRSVSEDLVITEDEWESRALTVVGFDADGNLTLLEAASAVSDAQNV